jgi:F0F1-type ATP synthase assembly protein I
MPDITIPAALLVSLGVLASAILALRTGDWKSCAITGGIAAWFNLICFFRRLFIQRKLHDEIKALRAQAGGNRK